jgi:uncharacterized protein (DUF58 family)
LFDEAFLRRLEQLALVARQVRHGRTQGERRSPKRGRSVEFADYRDYVPGDDLRMVDWNVYARLGRLFVKLFAEEEDTTVHFLLDASESMRFGQPRKWDYAMRLAGALGYIALVGMDRITAAVMHEGRLTTMPPIRTKRQALAWFDWLQAIRPGGEAHLGPAMREYAARAQAIGPAVVIGDLLDPSWDEGLSALFTWRFEVTVLHVLSPEEVNPDLEGDLELIDSETGQAVEITADYDLLMRYRDRVEAWRTQIKDFCAQREMNYVAIETSVSLEALLFSHLRVRAVLR